MMSCGIVSLFTNVTLVPTPVTTSTGVTPPAVIVTTLAGAGVGAGAGPGAGGGAGLDPVAGAGVGEGVDGASADPQAAEQNARQTPTRQEITFARGNPRSGSRAGGI